MITLRLIDAVECGDDALLYAFSLHDGREKLGTEFEAVRIVGELIAKIPIACGCFAGDDGDALAEEREL